MTNDDRDFVNQIADLLHNLPHQLETASTDKESDELLRRYAQAQRPIPAAWISSHLDRLGAESDDHE